MQVLPYVSANAVGNAIWSCVAGAILGWPTMTVFADPLSNSPLSFRDPAAIELKAAIASGDIQAVQAIVAKVQTHDCLELDEEGRTALHYAVQHCVTETSDPK